MSKSRQDIQFKVISILVGGDVGSPISAEDADTINGYIDSEVAELNADGTTYIDDPDTLDDALFTGPAHPFWGGCGLIGTDGKLMGIGSLILQQGDGKGRRLDMNMVVPIGLLAPIMSDLLSYGRVNRPARPWLGMYATESEETLVVGGLADNGPAEQAGLRTGDKIVTVNDEDIPDLAGLWRRVWASGSAGAEVRLQVRREGSARRINVRSADRASFLKSPKLH